MRPTDLLLAAAIAAGLGGGGCSHSDAAPPAVSRGDIVLAADTEIVATVVSTRDTFAGLLHGAGIADADVHGIVTAIRPVFDPRRLHEGLALSFERALDGRIRHLECDIDALRYVRVTPVGDAGAHVYAARVASYETRSERAVVSGTIDDDTPSLFAAMQQAGEEPELSIALADIFSGEIDFNTDLQPGDEFRLVVRKTFRESRLAAYGPIEAAVFATDGRRLTGVRFVNADGTSGYYDAQGRSLKRFFLRSPLKFDPRITSGFSRARMHPVLHTVRAHLGVDYGAPIGAPVVAVSNGVVIRAGWSGGAGRLVGIRHASGYESYYLHLSSIAVRPGARVSQGQVIGRVGQSGLATGPHLDYRLKKNGVYVNPVLEHRKLPPGEPIPPERLEQFASVRDEALRAMGGPRPEVVTASGAPPAGDAR